MSLTREEIISARDTKIERVSVPEWGGEVCVRVMSGEARDRLDAFLAKAIDDDGKLVNPKGLRTLVCILGCCDERGNDLFKPNDVDALAAKNSVALDRVWRAVAALNGLNDKAMEAARSDFLAGQKKESGSE